MSQLDDMFAGLADAEHAAAQRGKETREAQLALPRLLSGEPAFFALKRAVDDIESRAPQDHDVLIRMDDLIITEARFIEPHTFLFEGIDQDGKRAGIVCHFTQLNLRIVYSPKRGAERIVSRVIQGFAPQ